MNENNEFALVPRPPSEIEKAKPGAKRILSVMVADTLALTSKGVNTETDEWVAKGTSYFDSANYVEAFKWYRKAAERDHAQAQCFLGHCYVSGWGVSEDAAVGLSWFHKSANLGHVSAQRWLGDYYERAEEYASAVKWYRLAAEHGDFSSQYELGHCYRDGKGVAQNQIEAVKWYRKAAEQNLSTAQNALGSCYRDGQGLAKDYTKAVMWFRKAAEQNFSHAQFNLGLCYVDGKGVMRDYEQAAYWYRKAAEQGFWDAQENLGALYADGRAAISIEDAVDAYQWVKVAEQKGYAGAAKTVHVISAMLSPEELREAERRYQELCTHKNWLYELVSKNLNLG